jgi:L-threonylcarbamoyladenylate synthase
MSSPQPPSAVDPAVFERAVDILCRGGLVAYPTDTVYGLAVLPTDDRAIDRLFAAKGRPIEKAVPLLIASPADLALVAGEVPEVARLLMHAFWPGALTIVLPRAAGFRSKALGETVAVRVPDHAVPRELVRLLGAPITGTSANASGGAEPLTAGDVRAQLGEAVDLVIDGGRCPGGKPSTVVDCTTEAPRVLRDGAISREELVRAAGVRFE